MSEITDLLSLFPKKLLEKCQAFPIARENGAIRLLMANPGDLEAIDLLAFACDLDVVPEAADAQKIKILLEENAGQKSDFDHLAAGLAVELKKSRLDTAALNTPEDLKKSGQAEPVVKMVDLLINEAIHNGASDIHIEPHEDKVVVRNRIDGLLKKAVELPAWMAAPLTSRIKILADLDIAEKRVPQDGRIKKEADGITIDLRISTLPTHFGEKTVIRILRHSAELFSLDTLGFSLEEIGAIEQLIHKPQGLIFVTGPTGSGKSSSLFAFLNQIKGKDINITTIENPIEIKLPGINQVQVNEKAGLTFAKTLRSILRQDPDVILIGEIRDGETASIAVQAAQTGHLVFSTLHTNDAASALIRLKDLGVPPFLIASSILSIFAQRLVRRLCDHCKTPFTPGDDLVFKFRHLFGDIAIPASFHALGCVRCNQTGYTGRVGIYEILSLDTCASNLIMSDFVSKIG